MRMGQEGPRTLPKCRMSGIRFVRNRVSIMTAALLVTEPLKGFTDSASPSCFGFGLPSPSIRASVESGLEASGILGAAVVKGSAGL